MLEIAVEVPPVGVQGVLGQPTLDVEVGEPAVDRPLQRSGAAQLSTCSNGIESMPNASATGAHVM